MVRDGAWWDAVLLAFSHQHSLGVPAFCLSRGIRPSQFYYQQRKRGRGAVSEAVPPAPVFREYRLRGEEMASLPAPSEGWGMRLHVGGVVIELASGFADEASLRTVLSCCR